MNKDLKHILMDRLTSNTLASVYLLNFNSKTTNAEVWVDEFVKLITPLPDHPDVLKIYKDEKSNEYKVDSKGISELLKFTSTRPYKLKKKFIFLFDAEDLSVIVSNKLLKLFEEMSEHYALFLMVKDDATLLPTVLSRAVKLKIESNEGDLGSEKIDYSAVSSPYELLSITKLSTSEEKDFIEQKINEILRVTKSYEDVSRLLSELKSYEESAAFNNAKLGRLSGLFS